MEKGRSRLLIAEMVMPTTNVPVYHALMDINMMRYSGMLRTEEHWRSLLDSAGLRVLKVWTPAGNDSVIEAVADPWSGRC